MAVKLVPGRVAGIHPWRAKNSPGKRGGGPDHGAEQATGTEGLIVDSVYAKALALAQRPVGGQTVVFWHTGGAPALFATQYARAFDG